MSLLIIIHVSNYEINYMLVMYDRKFCSLYTHYSDAQTDGRMVKMYGYISTT
jgi:hypothetical protein